MKPRKCPEQDRRPGRPIRITFLFAVVALLTTACQYSPLQQAAYPSGLLLIDPLDDIHPNTDLLAVSAQPNGTSLTLRMDLLDFSSENAPVILLLLDTFPGSTLEPTHNFTELDQWETSIAIAPDLVPRITGEYAEIDPQKFSSRYDDELDAIWIDLPREVLQLPGPFGLAVATMDPTALTISDVTVPTRSDSPSGQPIQILLSFHNVFPSETPAQALRSWDGAHNGPAGERFGLRHLVDAVERNQVPVILTDLRKPDSLAGLQLLGADQRIRLLEDLGYLTLPDSLPFRLCEQVAALGWPEMIQGLIRTNAGGYDYAPAEVLTCYGHTDGRTISGGTSHFRLILIPDADTTDDPAWIESETHGTFMNLPSTTAAFGRSSGGGPALALRRLLAANLGSNDSQAVVVLGADFQRSFMGDPQTADATLRWIASQPWIQPLELRWDRLVGHSLWIPAEEQLDSINYSLNENQRAQALSLLDMLPFLGTEVSGQLRSFAWGLLLDSHTEPACQPRNDRARIAGDDSAICESRQQALRAGLTHLEVAQAWERSLRQDPEPDPVAVLESDLRSPTHGYIDERWFAMLSRRANHLDALLTFHPVTGLRPLLWDHQVDPTSPVTITIIPDKDSTQLLLEFHSSTPRATVELPIYLPPSDLTDRACVSINKNPDSIRLGCPGEPEILLEIAGGDWGFNQVYDSPGRWDVPEDPNQEMPSGHYLPFPLGLLTIHFEAQATLSLTINESHPLIKK